QLNGRLLLGPNGDDELVGPPDSTVLSLDELGDAFGSVFELTRWRDGVNLLEDLFCFWDPAGHQQEVAGSVQAAVVHKAVTFGNRRRVGIGIRGNRFHDGVAAV